MTLVASEGLWLAGAGESVAVCLPDHHRQELREIDSSVSIGIDLIDHILRNSENREKENDRMRQSRARTQWRTLQSLLLVVSRVLTCSSASVGFWPRELHENNNHSMGV